MNRERGEAWMPRREEPSPDFCIVGAPKCGTTALFSYLGQSENVFVPSKKEPNFFSFDFPRHRATKTLGSYVSLFSSAQPHQQAGEGSVWYLYSDAALPALFQYRPDVKIIIMLRNPVDAAYSLHAQKLFSLDEDVPSFADAWALQSMRDEGRRIPAGCRAASQLQYFRIFCYSWQLMRAFGLFSREQVKVIIYEEFFENPSAAFVDVCRFLRIPEPNQAAFAVVNASRRRHFPKLMRILRQTIEEYPRTAAVGKMGANALGLRPVQWFEEWNSRIKRRAPLDPEFREQLASAFSDDIGKVEDLLGRSLPCWKDARPPERSAAAASARSVSA